MLAVDETDAPLRPVVVEKLMGDAIRAQVTQSDADALPFKGVKDTAFEDLVIGDRLRDILRGLGPVFGPVCVFEKKMWPADRGKGQNRLLISCKDKSRGSKRGEAGPKEEIPFAKMFTPKEKTIVHEAVQKTIVHKADKEKTIVHQADEKTIVHKADKEHQENNEISQERKRKRKRKWKDNTKENVKKEKLGLDVQAYDRNGEVYHLKCRYLTSNTGYRIIGSEWTNFLRNNKMLFEKTGERKKRRKGKKPSMKAEGLLVEKTGGKKKRRKGKNPEPDGNQPK